MSERVVSDNIDALVAGGYFWLLANLGVEIRVEINEGIAANAARTYIDMHSPQTIMARVDYHPGKTGMVAFAHQHGIDLDLDLGPPCLVVEEDLGGYKPVISSFGLREEEVAENRWLLLDHTSPRPYSWHVPTSKSEYGSAALHRWLGEKAESGEIPWFLNQVLYSCGIEYRYEAREMFRWLLGVFGVMKRPYDRGLLLETIHYLMELRSFIRENELLDSWPVAVGWSIRLSAYCYIQATERA